MLFVLAMLNITFVVLKTQSSVYLILQQKDILLPHHLIPCSPLLLFLVIGATIFSLKYKWVIPADLKTLKCLRLSTCAASSGWTRRVVTAFVMRGAVQEVWVGQNVTRIDGQCTKMDSRVWESISVSYFCMNIMGNCHLEANENLKNSSNLVGQEKSWSGGAQSCWDSSLTKLKWKFACGLCILARRARPINAFTYDCKWRRSMADQGMLSCSLSTRQTIFVVDTLLQMPLLKCSTS